MFEIVHFPVNDKFSRFWAVFLIVESNSRPSKSLLKNNGTLMLNYQTTAISAAIKRWSTPLNNFT